MKLNLTFDDVAIEPQFSSITSEQVNVKTKFLGETIFPFLSSMDISTMYEYGCRGVLLPNSNIDESVKELKRLNGKSPYVSIGLGDRELERAAALSYNGAERFVISSSIGAANMEVVRQTKALRKVLGSDGYIVVGDFATGKNIQDFKFHLGKEHVDAYKTNIGNGNRSARAFNTGIGVHAFSGLVDCVKTGNSIVVSSDFGDNSLFNKALAAGAKAIIAPVYLKDLKTVEFNLRLAMSEVGASNLEEFVKLSKFTEIA